MPAIITITFNPALDKSATIQALMPEKKLKCSVPKVEAGGGGINVARAIKKLGGNATAIYLAGGTTGDLLMSLLNAEGIDQQVIRTRNDSRENIVIVDESTGLQYRFVMPGLEVFEEEWKKLLQAVSMQRGVAYIVASGSLPPGVPLDIFADIASIAKTIGARFILDTSGQPLKLALEQDIFLLKPSLRELCSIVSAEQLQGLEIEEAAQGIIRAGKCEALVVSLGASGAMLVTKKILKQFAPPPVNAKSTVGAGDSMVAGITYSLYMGKTLEDAVKYGVACGTAATMHEGTGLCGLPDVEMLYGLMNN